MTAGDPLLITRARLVPGLGEVIAPLVDVEIREGRIWDVTASVGHTGDIDADGATLLPGLWDHHTHFSTHALISNCISLEATDPASAVLAAVESQVVGGDPEAMVLGFGFRSAGWPHPPTREMLDAIGNVPIALIASDMHSVWASTTALAEAGFPGHPTGFLVEDDAFTAIMNLMGSRAAQLDMAVGRAASHAAARGVVGVVDFEMQWAVGAWARRAAHGPLPLHVEAATYPQHLDRLLSDGFATGDDLGGGLRVGPLKVIFDGSMGTMTALCDSPYPQPLPHLPHGQANLTTAELHDLLRRAEHHGVSAAVHAIGDRGCRLVLDAFEATGVRGSVEHAQFVRAADRLRFRMLGVAASVQPSHLLADQDLVDEVWPGAGADVFPLRSLLDAGAELRFGSDAPVAPLDPWASMGAAVHRRHHPLQSVTPLEAMRASTRSSITPGATADLVLVPTSPEALLGGAFAVPDALATLVAGRITHQGT